MIVWVRPFVEETSLEVELASELQLTRIAGTGDLAGATCIGCQRKYLPVGALTS